MSSRQRALWRLAFDLRFVDSAEEAAASLGRHEDGIAVDGLCDLLLDPPNAACGVAAARALARLRGSRFDAPVADALAGAAVNAAGPVRFAALRALVRGIDAAHAPLLARIVREDPAPLVRRVALRGLEGLPVESRWPLMGALSDPVWRVRGEAIRSLLRWSASDPALVAKARARVDLRDPLARGAFAYFEHEVQSAAGTGANARARARGRQGNDEPTMPVARPARDWWDDDPAVMRTRIYRLTPEEVRQELSRLLSVVPYNDSRPLHECMEAIRAFVVDAYGRYAGPSDFAAVLALLEDPRHPFVTEWVPQFFAPLPDAQADRIAAWTIHASNAPSVSASALAWALERARSRAGIAEPEGLLHLTTHASPRVRARAILAAAAHAPAADALVRRVILEMLASDDASAVEPRVAALDAAAGRLSSRELEVCAAFGSACLVIHEASEPGGQSGVVRRAWTRAVLRAASGSVPACLETASTDADAGVRAVCAEWLARSANTAARSVLAGTFTALEHDANRFVREAALTKDRAAQLWREPELEPSWRVLAGAARLLGRSIWEIAPRPEPRAVEGTVAPASQAPRRRPASFFRVPPRLATGGLPNALERARDVASAPQPHHAPPFARRLGPDGPMVSPLAISGRYGLPDRGFFHALDRGVNFFFWEPEYEGLTRFSRQLEPRVRDELVFAAGTFEAHADGVERDLMRALSELRRDRIDLFLVFWVRSHDRLLEEVTERLMELQARGRIGAFGISTHQRPLARRAIAEGFGAIMVRHSAAHRRAEETIFPYAAAAGTSVLTFSNLVCGQMLVAGETRAGRSRLRTVRAPDCYRYSLSQPGVTACLSAPRDLAQLRENLEVLDCPVLDAEAADGLRAVGDGVYGRYRAFADMVSSHDRVSPLSTPDVPVESGVRRTDLGQDVPGALTGE